MAFKQNNCFTTVSCVFLQFPQRIQKTITFIDFYRRRYYSIMSLRNYYALNLPEYHWINKRQDEALKASGKWLISFVGNEALFGIFLAVGNVLENIILSGNCIIQNLLWLFQEILWIIQRKVGRIRGEYYEESYESIMDYDIEEKISIF